MKTSIHAFHQEVQLVEATLKVRNLENALRFYQDLLGLRLMARDQNRCELSATGFDPALIILEQDLESIDQQPGDGGLYHLALLYPRRKDLAAALQRLLTHRYPLQGASDHGVSEAIYLSDPEGNGLELYVDRDEAKWPKNEEGVEMFTRRLDVHDLLSTVKSDAGNKDDVYKIPKETILGHVHLKVSDQKKADHFFCEVLGCHLRQQMNGASFYAFNGYHHHLAANTWESHKDGTHGSYGLQRFTVQVPPDRFEAIASSEYLDSGETDMGSKLLYDRLDFRLGSFDLILQKIEDEEE